MTPNIASANQPEATYNIHACPQCASDRWYEAFYYMAKCYDVERYCEDCGFTVDEYELCYDHQTPFDDCEECCG